MRRRDILGWAAALSGLDRARAEHGWKPYDGVPPVYLEGPVVVLTWADPHPHLELLHRAETRLPYDLRSRVIPRQKEPRDTAELLALATLPVNADGRWRVDLPTLARLSIWGVARPRIGEPLGVIGYPGPPVTGTPSLEAALLFVGDKVYPLRSDPA